MLEQGVLTLELGILAAGAIALLAYCWRRRQMPCTVAAVVWALVFAAGRPVPAAPPNYVLVKIIGNEGSGNGQFHAPRRVAANAAGDVWVADASNNRIEEFDPNGNLLQTVGSFGSGNGQFNDPQGVTVDSSGNVWVADSSNNRVEELTANGSFIKAFGSYGSGAGQINDAQAIAVDSSGNVWITDWWNNRIDEFTGNGTFVQMFGSQGSGTGQFSWLGGLTTDASGNVYVADSANYRVQEFNSSGVYLQTIGTTGQLPFPNDVTHDPSGNLWVATDYGLVEFSSSARTSARSACLILPRALPSAPRELYGLSTSTITPCCNMTCSLGTPRPELGALTRAATGPQPAIGPVARRTRSTRQ